jgi:hypothetical protein
MHTAHTLDIATLLTWLATEAIGAFMLRSWVASGGARAARQRRAQPEVMSLPVLAAHAGLNVAALLCWVVFLAVGAKPAAWLALALMAPAIGLGISTVTIWTPYPAPRHRGGLADGGRPDQAAGQHAIGPEVLPAEALRRALADEGLSERLVDELLARNLAPPPRTNGWNLRPLVPASHGALAIATFVLAVLSVVSAP